MTDYDAIILAGGLGTRLRDTVPELPKALAPIQSRPFLDLLLDKLEALPSIQSIILALGFRADQIQERYRQDLHPRVRFSIEDQPLGTGGAVRLALQQATSEQQVILNGDSYLDFDWTALKAAHEQHPEDATLCVTQVPNVGRYGQVETSKGRVIRFHEKSGEHKPGLINAGVYMAPTSLLMGQIPPHSSSFEHDVLPKWIPNRLYAHCVEGKFIDIGTPESYSTAQHYLKPLAECLHHE